MGGYIILRFGFIFDVWFYTSLKNKMCVQCAVDEKEQREFGFYILEFSKLSTGLFLSLNLLSSDFCSLEFTTIGV